MLFFIVTYSLTYVRSFYDKMTIQLMPQKITDAIERRKTDHSFARENSHI